MRKRGSLFTKAFVISVSIILLNVGFIVLKNFQNASVTGNSVTNVSDLQVSTNSKIIFGVQVVLLSLIMLFVFFYDRKKDKEESSDMDEELTKPHSNETDLDILYKILKKRKKINLSKIAKSFKVDKEVAMEWCKILETGELATIDYPGFGEPKLLLNESTETNINVKDILPKKEIAQPEKHEQEDSRTKPAIKVVKKKLIKKLKKSR